MTDKENNNIEKAKLISSVYSIILPIIAILGFVFEGDNHTSRMLLIITMGGFMPIYFILFNKW